MTGKFAQKDYGSKTYFSKEKDLAIAIENLSAGTKYIIHHFSEEREDTFLEVFDHKRSEKITWNIPTISSYITSEARLVMLPFFLKYQKNILYTDTDSLVMDIPLPEKYISETILGAFKKEHDTEIEIIGNKHYNSRVDGKKVHHIKGVSKRYKNLTLKEVNEIRKKEGKEKIEKKGKSKFMSFNKMTRTKESINRSIHAGMFVEVVKHMTNDYTKRNVKNNKTQTLKINE